MGLDTGVAESAQRSLMSSRTLSRESDWEVQPKARQGSVTAPGGAGRRQRPGSRLIAGFEE